VERARAQVAALIGADPKEIIFTSGATESNNLAIKGVAGFYKERRRHVVTTQTEHKCVLDSCRWGGKAARGEGRRGAAPQDGAAQQAGGGRCRRGPAPPATPPAAAAWVLAGPPRAASPQRPAARPPPARRPPASGPCSSAAGT
jgi:hypothetical protein